MTKILIEIDPELQRVVPAIPTDEIYTAACDALSILFISERFDAMYAAMLAAAPQPEPVDAWQPIETAPTNIEVFIGRFIDGVFVFGKAVCFYEVGNEFEGEFYRGWFWSIDDVCESVAECPTHWMPLPRPPAMSQGEQK